LFWAMMMKLSPGRRILLLIALVLPLHPINLNKYRRRKRAPGKIPHRPLAGVVQFAELTAATGAPDLSISSFTPYPTVSASLLSRRYHVDRLGTPAKPRSSGTRYPSANCEFSPSSVIPARPPNSCSEPKILGTSHSARLAIALPAVISGCIVNPSALTQFRSTR
jgi:hypothetical protein